MTSAITAVEFVDPTAVLTGTVTDGHSIADMIVIAYPTVSNNDDSEILIPTINGDNWAVSADSLSPGSYLLFIVTTDEAGNQSVSDPYELEVIMVVTAVEVSSIETNHQIDLIVWVALVVLLFLTRIIIAPHRRKKNRS